MRRAEDTLCSALLSTVLLHEFRHLSTEHIQHIESRCRRHPASMNSLHLPDKLGRFLPLWPLAFLLWPCSRC